MVASPHDAPLPQILDTEADRVITSPQPQVLISRGDNRISRQSELPYTKCGHPLIIFNRCRRMRLSVEGVLNGGLQRPFGKAHRRTMEVQVVQLARNATSR